MVYFFHCAGDNTVKIGWSDDVRYRVAQVQWAAERKLSIIMVLPGGREEERALHQQFEAYALGGEWFDFSDEIRQFVSKTPSLPHPDRRRRERDPWHRRRPRAGAPGYEASLPCKGGWGFVVVYDTRRPGCPVTSPKRWAVVHEPSGRVTPATSQLKARDIMKLQALSPC